MSPSPNRTNGRDHEPQVDLDWLLGRLAAVDADVTRHQRLADDRWASVQAQLRTVNEQLTRIAVAVGAQGAAVAEVAVDVADVRASQSELEAPPSVVIAPSALAAPSEPPAPVALVLRFFPPEHRQRAWKLGATFLLAALAIALTVVEAIALKSGAAP